MENGFWLTSMLFQIIHGFLISFKDTGLCTGFYCHVAKCHTVTDTQCLCTFSGKFHYLIVTSVCTNFADDRKDQVTCGHTFLKFPCQVEFYGFRNKYPGSTCYHSVKEICASHTGTKCTECTVGTCMTVCAKDQLARTHIIFNHDLMTYTFAFPEINVVCFCKISHFFLRRCCFRAVRRYVMVHDKYKFLCICNVRIF